MNNFNSDWTAINAPRPRGRFAEPLETREEDLDSSSSDRLKNPSKLATPTSNNNSNNSRANNNNSSSSVVPAQSNPKTNNSSGKNNNRNSVFDASSLIESKLSPIRKSPVPSTSPVTSPAKTFVKQSTTNTSANSPKKLPANMQRRANNLPTSNLLEAEKRKREALSAVGLPRDGSDGDLALLITGEKKSARMLNPRGTLIG